MVSEIRQIRIALANLEVQLEDFIAQSKQINEQKIKLEQEVAELKKKLEENNGTKDLR